MQLKNVSDETLTITEQSHTEEIASGKSFIVSDDKAREVINMYGNKVEQKLKVDGDVSSGEISDLDDVEIVNPQDKQIMQFNGTSEKWTNSKIRKPSIQDKTILLMGDSYGDSNSIANPRVPLVISKL
jgi:hypothetical protein